MSAGAAAGLHVVMIDERGATNRCLAALAAAARARGLRLAGTVQINVEIPGTERCDMEVEVLPAGPVLRISQSLGPGASGCRLDPGALERAVAITEERLAQGADLVIVNKFGKHEAAGRGLRGVIAAALGAGIPVVVGLNRANHAAFCAFCGGEFRQIETGPGAAERWLAAAFAAPGGGARG